MSVIEHGLVVLVFMSGPYAPVWSAGTALTAAERAVPTLLRKALLSLQTLSIENSQRLLESYILRDASWRQQQAELRALLASGRARGQQQSCMRVPC